MTDYEKKEFARIARNVIITAGGILTLAFAIFYIVDLINGWYRWK
jgi:hypothetical protein